MIELSYVSLFSGIEAVAASRLNDTDGGAMNTILSIFLKLAILVGVRALIAWAVTRGGPPTEERKGTSRGNTPKSACASDAECWPTGWTYSDEDADRRREAREALGEAQP